MGRNTSLLNLNTYKVIRNIKILSVLLVVSFAFLFIVSERAYAASIYFSPVSGSYKVGSSFSINILAGSIDQSMNAAAGIVSFPSDKLEIISLSKSNSILNLWVQEPTFSNSAGTINFEGIVLNPGFIGSSGNILTVTFKAKTSGTVSLILTSGSVLANDGKGTNILSTLGNAQFYITSSATTPTKRNVIPVAEASVEDESVPKIISATHPNTNKWYQNSNPEFSWNLPSSVVEVQTLVGSKPNSIPIISYRPPIFEKIVEDMSDGTWYFHLRFKNSDEWGETTHFKFNVDTERPERFEIREIERKDPTTPRVQFIFDADDETSGIYYYEVSVDGGNQIVWKDSGDHTFVTDALEPGTHILIAKAVDKALNSRANSIEFVIDPLWPPVIEEYPSEIEVGKTLLVSGDAMYENVQVAIWLQRGKDDPRVYKVISGDDGQFTFSLEEKLKSGTYTLWAIVTDDRDAKSDASEKVTIKIKKVSLLTIGSLAISVLAIVVPLVVLIIFLVFFLWYSWYKFTQFRKKMHRKIKHTESTIHKAFELLRGDVEEHVHLLKQNKRKQILTKEESKLLQQLEKSLEDAEYVLQEEMENVEEEINNSSLYTSR